MDLRTMELHLTASSDAYYFLFCLDQICKKEIDQATDVLDEDDLQKVKKLLFEKDYHRHLLIYALTKQILGHFLEKKPSRLHFFYNSYGKPYLRGNPLHFNLSHSGAYAFLGIHPRHPIGVDIEKKGRQVPLSSFLQPTEINMLSHCPIQLWTAKEAYVKALGIGFSQSLPTLKSYNKQKTKDVTYFVSQIAPSFPPLIVKGYDNVITDYHLATCINK